MGEDVRLFWLPKAIIPLLLVMFVCVGIRVNAYGVTENRYFAIALGVWVLVVMVYLALTGQKIVILSAGLHADETSEEFILEHVHLNVLVGLKEEE